MIAAVVLSLAVLANSAVPQPEVRNVRISSPKILLSREKSDSDVRISGLYKIEMSFSRKTVKKPVSKLVCLCEVNGSLVMSGIVLDQPDTVKGIASSEIFAAIKRGGVSPAAVKDREKTYMDPDVYTPYLHEVSKDLYASATYGSAELRKGFVSLGKSEKMPKLLLYRIEVWQNGAMVALYESSHAGLGAYALPKDWYVWRKYAGRFKYAEIR